MLIMKKFKEKSMDDNTDPDYWVRFWLDSALKCPDFIWDEDQRKYAEAALMASTTKAIREKCVNTN